MRKGFVLFSITLLTLVFVARADSPQPRILLVLDSHYWEELGNPPLVEWFIEALEANNLAYDNCTIPAAPAAGPGYNTPGCKENRMLKDYDIVIWFTGDDGLSEKYPTLKQVDRVNLKTFLDNGGRLFLTGQHIGPDCLYRWESPDDCPDSEFYSDYLKARSCFEVEDESEEETLCFYNSGDFSLIGKDDALGKDFSEYINELDISGGAGNQGKPTIMEPVDGSESFLYTNLKVCCEWWWEYWYCYYHDDCKWDEWSAIATDTVSGVVKADTGGPLGYKTVFFGFGFEGIASQEHRNELMWRIFGYLSAPAALGTKVYANGSLIEGVDYIDLNITCDSNDPQICRRSWPKINATCKDLQLLANVSGAEYYVKDITDPVFPERFAGNGTYMQAVDGVFNDDDVYEAVEAYVTFPDIGTYGVYFKTFTLYAHCNDTDGYWGKYDEYTFTVDDYHPTSVNLIIENGNRYTNSIVPEISVTFTDFPAGFPNYMRFSCDPAVGWTSWVLYTTPYSGFDITNTEVGCPPGDGNRTIYVQIRDESGNWDDVESVASYWVVLDRVAPVSEVIPVSNSWLKSTNNVTIIFYDPTLPDGVAGSGVHINYTSNGTVGITQPLFNNTPFNPGWVSEGSNVLDVWINDTVGNSNYTQYVFNVDDTPPEFYEVSIEGLAVVNWISLDIVNIKAVILDYGSGVNSSTVTFEPSAGQIINQLCSAIANGYSCTVQWNTTGLADGTYAIIIRANDTLAFEDNQATYTLTLDLDKTPPYVGINYPPQFYNTTSEVNILNISVSDPEPGSGVDTSSVFYIFENETGQYDSSGAPDVWTNIPMDWASGFYLTTWSAEAGLADGRYAIRIKANDTIDVGPDNQNASVFVNITIDNSPPTTTDNSSSTEPWYSTDVTIELTCTDALVGCDVTLYCIYDDGTLPCTPTTPGNLVSVTCPGDSTCVKLIRYRSNDTLGNLEVVKTSNRTKIDKQAPSITIDSPSESKTYSGSIDLLTSVADIGSGVEFAWYEIRNASNLSEIFHSGFLSAPDFDAIWDSTEDVPESETVVLNVSANDTLGWLRFNVNVTFVVDNTLPSVVIYYPKEIYLNSSFDLDLRAARVGANNISFAQYNISNATWFKVNTTENTIDPAIGVPTFNFTELIDITSWRDGNYTLNFSANNTLNTWAIDVSWFAIDRIAPVTSDDSDPTEPWYATDQIISLGCADDSLPDSTPGSGCDVTLYCVYEDGATPCDPTEVGTTLLVDCPSGSTCVRRIRYKSNDTAGNVEFVKISNRTKIDKQAPFTGDNVTGLWYSTDQVILLTCSDIGSPAASGSGCNITLYCVDTLGICTPNLLPTNTTPLGQLEVNYTFDATCPQQSVCEFYVRYRSNDTLANSESIKTAEQLVKVDKKIPSVSLEEPLEGIVGGVIEIRAIVTDAGSGIQNVSYVISNTTYTTEALLTQVTVELWNGSFNTDTIAEGYYNVSIKAFDSVGNLNDTQRVLIYVDNTPPEVWNYFVNLTSDLHYGDLRIYPNEAVFFRVNISDVANVSEVILTVSRLGIETDYTLSLLAGTIADGLWGLVYDGTDQLGVYEFTKLFVNDTLGNLFANSSLGMRFFVVNGSVEVILDTTSTTDAGRNKSFNLTFEFNKTFEWPNLLAYVPPNIPLSSNQTPNYINQTPFTCYFGTNGCDVIYEFDAQPYITFINITGIEANVTLSMLTDVIKAGTPPNDTTDAWIVEFRGVEFQDITRIKTPHLNITRIFCNELLDCTVYQNVEFNLTVELRNTLISGVHTGDAHRVYAEFESVMGGGVELVTDVLDSGELENVTWQLNITEAGNYSFVFDAWEVTKQYNATQRSIAIEVKDTELPTIVRQDWEVDNIFNTDESAVYYVEVRDNVEISQVWLTIINPDGFRKNYTLALDIGNLQHGIWKIVFTNTTLVGNYTVFRIYANDTEDNLRSITPLENLAWFEAKELSISAEVEIHSLLIGENQSVYANITGNASLIQSVKAFIVKPGLNETTDLRYAKTLETSPYSTYHFNGTYTNATRSGDYEIRVNATLESGISATATTGFNVSYGNVSIKVEKETLYLPRDIGPFNLTWFIVPDKGDLTRVNGTLIIEDETVINLTTTHPQTQEFGNISWEIYKEGYLAEWEINVTDILGNTTATLQVNSTTPSVIQNTSKNITVVVIEEDLEPPIIYDFGHMLEKQNLRERNLIWVNATDVNTAIERVAVEVKYPLGGKENTTATKVAPDIYELWFTNVNETGNFTYRVFARDVAGNEINSTTKTFEAFDEYLVNVNTNHPIYNKWERVHITAEVKNVRGEKVSDFNLTLLLNKNSTLENVTLVNNSITDVGSYFIERTDPPEDPLKPVTYWVYAFVSKDGNEGEAKNNFAVSKLLPAEFIFPKEGDYFPVNVSVNVSVRVTNIRGEPIDDASVTLACGECTPKYIVLEWYPSTQTYVGFPAYTAPPVAKFGIIAEAVDPGRNVDDPGILPAVSLTTIPEEVVAPPPAPPVPPPACECTAWEDVGCGYGGCEATELYQVRSCTPVGCAPEARCIAHPKCVLDFEFEIEPAKLEIPQGETKIATGTLKNLGEIELPISVSLVEKECVDCTITFDPSHTLAPLEERDFSIAVHARLYERVGTYGLTLKAIGSLPGVEPLLREKRLLIEIAVQVERIKLDRLRNGFERLRARTLEYERIGVDVSDVLAALERLSKALADAYASIEADDLEELKRLNDEIDRTLRDAEARLLALWLRKLLLEHKWFIITGLILGFITAYWITQVTLPYRGLEKEIAELQAKERELVKAREATEMDYFHRRIDESTFRAIMIERQSDILRIRESIKLKANERSMLIATKLNPVSFLRWVAALPKSTARMLARLMKGLASKLPKLWPKLKIRPRRK